VGATSGPHPAALPEGQPGAAVAIATSPRKPQDGAHGLHRSESRRREAGARIGYGERRSSRQFRGRLDRAVPTGLDVSIRSLLTFRFEQS
jgi:hypothetical protein